MHVMIATTFIYEVYKVFILTCSAVSRPQNLAAGRHFVLRNNRVKTVGEHYLEIL